MKSVIFLGFLIVGVSQGNLVHGHGMDKSYRFSFRRLLTDWCALQCDNTDKSVIHIACEVGSNCRATEPCVFGDLDKDKILEAHNKLRDNFAAGKESRAEGVTAANMAALSWDDDLAFTASCNLAKCEETKHDKCRFTPKFELVGQNLHMRGGADCVEKAPDLVQGWYDEVENFDKAKIISFAKEYQFGMKTGHFTQLMWATTTHVGCALSKRPEGVTSSLCTMACNYGPSGNLIRRGMFIEGEPCSQCADNLKCGTKYKALCGDGGQGQSIHRTFGAFLYGVLLLLLAIFGK